MSAVTTNGLVRTGREESIIYDTCDRYLYYNDDPPVLQQSRQYLANLEVSTCNGRNTPDFQARKKRGELIPYTPWTQVKTLGSSKGSGSSTGAASGNTWSIVWDGNYSRFDDWANVPIPCTDGLPSSGELAKMAAANCYEQGFDALTFLAELTDIKSLFIHVGRGIIKLRKKIPWKMRDLASEWLCWRYGWRPLWNDIKSLHGLVTGANRLSTKDRHTGRYSSTTFGSSSDSSYEYDSGSAIFSVDITDMWEVSARGSVTADISLSDIQFNPIATAWELVPFSFVVDWFLDIGKTISAASFLALQRGYVAASGYHATCTRTLSASVVEAYDPQIVSLSYQQDASCTVTKTHRIPCRVPITPQFNPRLDVAKVIDIMAMVRQKWKRR